MTRVAWSALIVLMLEALPTDAFAQSRVCDAIRRGESATQAARRMTGNGWNAYQAWFEIMNASSKFVPKSQYDRIHAGWRACVVTPATRSLSSNANHVDDPGGADVAADVSEAPDGSGVPEVPAAPTALASPGGPGDPGTPGTMTPAMDPCPQLLTSFEGSRVSISRCCGFALRWWCRGSGGGWSTTISLEGRRHPSSWRPLPIDSSMSSNGHWFGTTSGSAP